MFGRPVLQCAVMILVGSAPTIAQISPEAQNILDPLLNAYKQCVFPAATKYALVSNESADVVRQVALASCSKQHDALAKGFGLFNVDIQDLDKFVDGQILLAVLSARSKNYDEAFDRGDYVTALKLIRPLADEGDPIAETRLGQMYLSGKGLPIDFGEAAKWLRLGANQGVDSAEASLGVLYFTGQGVPRDLVLSYMWMSLAVAQGFQSAASVLEKTSRLMTPDQISDAQKRARDWRPSRQSMTK